MAADVDDILIAGNGKLWVAPVGTAAPADESAAPGANFLDVGFLSEDGATIVDSHDLSIVNVWQLFYPARRHITGRDFTVAVAVRQWDKTTLPLALGGGALTTATAGHFKYVPPAPETVDDRALLLDWADGTRKYRLVVPRCMITENVEIHLSRQDPADLPITFGILGSDGVDPWYLLTNDPALNPA